MAEPVASSGVCVARRGSTWLSEEELRAHLAALLRLEHVSVLLGAGASAGAPGGRTMRDAWKDFEIVSSTSLAWLERHKFIESGTPPNLELLADALEIARVEWRRGKRRGLRGLDRAIADLKRAVIRAALLKRKWWSRRGQPDEGTSQLSSHRLLLQRLCGSRAPGQAAPWVFTTNYDLAVEWAAETLGLHVTTGFSGLHARRFSPHNFDLALRNTLAKGEARFGTYSVYLAKLHGSLNWRQVSAELLLEEAAHACWPRIRRFLDGEIDDAAVQMVFPSAAKYMQTVGFVLGELFRRFAEALARPQSTMITVGYSFSDEHLNRLLLTALQNPTLQLVAYVPSFGREGEAVTWRKGNRWLRRLSELSSPQVTIVGGETRAYMNALVGDLPEPALFDEQAARIRELLKEFNEHSREGADRDVK